MAGLQKEVWIAGIQENPIPDNSFVFASTDKSEYVENNKLHLAEAGIEPGVHENYFAGSETDLPLATITDIPNEVVLNTYSTDRTRHRDLQEVELQYNKRASVTNRHKTALAKNMGIRAAFAWSPATDDTNNKIAVVGGGKFLDAIIDMQAFYNGLDIYDGLNICLTAEHMAIIKKEDKVLYKEILNTSEMYGFKVYRYNKTALYTSANAKKPFGTVKAAGDKNCSFTWCTNEVFRCFGDTEMYETIRSAASQADEISFAQRALVGNIRATNPKYLGAILS
ncbi:hypothetical protein [Flavobacterium soyangense]|jgi:hypothetical protein|uniref:Phage capsid protein n=1 Tax=Flavobacterium soyangense TaxID=2023265 RepID=A0A930U603_9FLAO|nr:hypothetical protein [Flavobacterium soyangense]MBF2707518.1 hypothetical protein [Flavobacterium soyangense]